MKKKENNIVGHDCIFGIYEIIKSDKTDYDKFLELQSKYGIDNIEQGYLLEGVVSRKKQMVPVIMDVFSN